MTTKVKNDLIYDCTGLGQRPTKKQGWVIWFIRPAMEKKPITIYGDGKQLRDILFIIDLLDAFDKVGENIERTKGQAYNIRGGRKFHLYP